MSDKLLKPAVRVYGDVVARQLSIDEYTDMSVDSPELQARIASRAAHDHEVVAVALPMGVWRAILPTVITGLHQGVQALRAKNAMLKLMGAVGEEITVTDREAMDYAVRNDREVAQLLTYFLNELGQQTAGAPDPFFAPDTRMLVEHIAETMELGEFQQSLQELQAGALSPESVAASLAFTAKLKAAAEREAADEVAQQLALFAADTDHKGKTLN